MAGSIEANITQFAVGQGGFLVGRIWRTAQNAQREFTYAFDCGSINREHFETGLDACALSRLDVLFISHLDLDHVNGIDALASKMQIDRVVLPCLDTLQSIVLACEGSDDAGVRGSIASLLRDPVAWFGERGVKSVYFVGRDSSGEGPDMRNTLGANPPDSPRPRSNGRSHKSREGEEERLPYSIRGERESAVQQIKTSRGIVEYMTFEGDVQVSVEPDVGALVSDPFVWALIPYVHPFSKITLDVFARAASNVLKKQVPIGTGLVTKRFTKQLLATLCNESSRKALKACYAILSSDNNLPSLSLYSGPVKPLHPTRIWHNVRSGQGPQFWRHRLPLGEIEGCAWLSTGDANLSSLQTRAPWLKRYEQFLPAVAVFILPHHGSNRHIHDDVLSRMPSSIKVACAATERAKHPHPSLLRRLDLLGQSFIQVSEEQPSEFSLQVKLSG